MIHLHFSMRKSLNVFHPYDITQRSHQINKDINLATIWRAKLKGVHEHCKSLQIINMCTQNANPNKNEHDSQWGLLPYGNNG